GTSLSTQPGSAGGTASSGDSNVRGGSGGAAIRLSGTVGITGVGGESVFAPNTEQYNSGATGGPNGYSYGGGGGGAFTNGAAQAGGSGNSGAVFVVEYY